MVSLLANEVSVRIGTIAAGTDDERTVFVAPHDVIIEKIYFTVGTTIAAGATDFTTISFQNKATAGTGTDELATFNTNTGETTLTAFVPHNAGALANNTISKGEAVSFVKVDAASGDAVDEGIVTIVYKAQPGLHQYQV
jgi:hypothetical protein